MRITRTIALTSAASLLALGTLAPLPAMAAPASDAAPVPQAPFLCTVSDSTSGSRSYFSGSTDSIVKGGKYKVTIKVKPKSCNGKVTIKDGKKKLKTITLKKGKASFTFPKSLKAGTHNIKYSYTRPATAKRKPLTWTRTLEVVQPKKFATAATAYTGYSNNFIPVVLDVDYSGTLKNAQIDWLVGGQENEIEGSGRISLPDSKKGFKGQVTAWFEASAYARYLTPGANVGLKAALYPQFGKPAITTDISIAIIANEFPVSMAGEPGTLAPGTYTVPAGKEPYSCHLRTYHLSTTSGIELQNVSVMGPGPQTITIAPTDTKMVMEHCGGAPVKVA
ncbi:MAG: Ig-like domain repeat protein [Bifidobacteriaceae bacterium]|jgi:hypothetical protein|nr:Ig-like domain repeat protein [Bifidobacteriaceae bacterium]